MKRKRYICSLCDSKSTAKGRAIPTCCDIPMDRDYGLGFKVRTLPNELPISIENVSVRKNRNVIVYYFDLAQKRCEVDVVSNGLIFINHPDSGRSSYLKFTPPKCDTLAECSRYSLTVYMILKSDKPVKKFKQINQYEYKLEK